MNKLNNDYNPRSTKKKKQKRKKRVFRIVNSSFRKLFDARDEIINLFEKIIFLYKGNVFKTKEK